MHEKGAAGQSADNPFSVKYDPYGAYILFIRFHSKTAG